MQKIILKRCENYCNTRFYFLDEKGNDFLLVECWCGNSGRIGFQHKANVFLNGDWVHRYKDKFFKVQYYNRTWERYRYQSLLRHVINNLEKDKIFNKEQLQAIKQEIENL